MDSYLVKYQTLINAFARERRSQRQQKNSHRVKGQTNIFVIPNYFFIFAREANESPIISDSIFNSKRFTDKTILTV